MGFVESVSANRDFVERVGDNRENRTRLVWKHTLKILFNLF